MTDIRQELQEKAKAMGIKLTAQQADQFQTYMELLLEWNEKINLTAITQPEEVVERVRHVKDCENIMDYVGTFRLDSGNHRVVPVEVRLAV